MRDRVKELRFVDVESLADHPGNYSRHTAYQSEAVSACLDEIGFADVMLAYEDGDRLVLIDGHLRRKLVTGVVPVVVLDLNRDEAELLIGTLDPLAMLAEVDAGRRDELAAMVTEFKSARYGSLLEDLRGWKSGEVIPCDEKDKTRWSVRVERVPQRKARKLRRAIEKALADANLEGLRIAEM